MKSQRAIVLPLVLLTACVLIAVACGKDKKSPAAPAAPPADTATPTATATPTNTPWCPGSGENGQSQRDSGGIISSAYTLASRIQLDAAVSVTGIKIYKQGGGLVQSVGFYTDDGTGNLPSTRLQQATYTDSGVGDLIVDIPDTWVTAGYYWLTISSTTASNAPAGICSDCGLIAALSNGQTPATWSNAYSGNYPNAVYALAVWTCP